MCIKVTVTLIKNNGNITGFLCGVAQVLVIRWENNFIFVPSAVLATYYG